MKKIAALAVALGMCVGFSLGTLNGMSLNVETFQQQMVVLGMIFVPIIMALLVAQLLAAKMGERKEMLSEPQVTKRDVREAFFSPDRNPNVPEEEKTPLQRRMQSGGA